MDKYELEQYAVERKIARAKTLDGLFAKLPKRKSKGDELGSLVDLIKNAHDLLIIYDSMGSAPGMGGITETAYEAAVERLTQVLAARAAQ